MLWAVLSGFIASALAPLFYKFIKKAAGILLTLIPVSLFAFFAGFAGEVYGGSSIKFFYEWIPSMGINLSFYLDGLSLTFALIITGIGTAVFLYASSYMKDDKYVDRFYVYILFFMASMLGVVLSDNIFAMFVFWELTSISSYLLIGFKHEKEDSRYSAWQALLVTGTGGLALMAGLIILQIITGSSEVSDILGQNTLITNSGLYTAALILVLLGAFTKSAQFPFHFWLPNAMAAPTPVSAYLHSATMVKAGVYLLARLNPAMGGTELWSYLLTGFGAVTMLFSISIALKQTDLKKLLAYSTVSVLGTLVMLIGIGTETALKGMIIYLIAHSLYKGGLFLYAGIIDHETGSRNVNKLSGLMKYMPVTASAGFLASLSMMGVFPFWGFIGKETLYDAALKFTDWNLLIILMTVTAGVFMFYIAAQTAWKPMLGKLSETPKKPHEAPVQMWAGPLVLGIAGLIFGLFPGLINNTVQTGAAAVSGFEFPVKIKLWHGFNTVLFLSLLTLAVGLVIYLMRNKLNNFLLKINSAKIIRPSYWYDLVFSGTLKTAELQTRFFQNGNLRYYIIFVLLTFLGLAGYSLLSFNNFESINIDFSLTVYEAVIALLITAASIFTIRAKTRLSAVIGLGVVGYGVAVIFIYYGAPDLAMTQFAIETLTVILFVLVLYKLPKFLQFTSTARRVRDFTIAGASGILMTLIILLVTSDELQSNLKKYFADNSLELGKGKNIVNVILVDFRAIDTMGEITVLAIAAIGVFALFKLKIDKDKDERIKDT